MVLRYNAGYGYAIMV